MFFNNLARVLNFQHYSSLESDIFLNPIILLNLVNCILPIPFINISSTISSLLQYFISILFIITISLMQWNLISIFFALPWCWGFFVIAIIDWFSSKIVIGSTEFSLISIRSCCNRIDSWAAFTNAIYSASAVDKATQICFLLFQLIAAPLLIKTNPDVNFQSWKMMKLTHVSDIKLLSFCIDELLDAFRCFSSQDDVVNINSNYKDFSSWVQYVDPRRILLGLLETYFLQVFV